jgi:hypothetical protein
MRGQALHFSTEFNDPDLSIIKEKKVLAIPAYGNVFVKELNVPSCVVTLRSTVKDTVPAGLLGVRVATIALVNPAAKVDDAFEVAIAPFMNTDCGVNTTGESPTFWT